MEVAEFGSKLKVIQIITEDLTRDLQLPIGLLDLIRFQQKTHQMGESHRVLWIGIQDLLQFLDFPGSLP